MQVCEHCRSRHSWDCDDGYAYPKGGCENFELDYSTLTDEQKKAIRRVLQNEERGNDRYEDDW